MLVNILLLLLSLVLLTAGAEALVRGAVVLALRLGVSSFFIGLTIVGFGTSTPELMTGVMAAVSDRPDMNIGNVVGSNIFNVAAILGVASLIRPTPVKLHLVRSEVAIVIGASILCLVLAATGSVISKPEGILLLGLLVLYVVRGYVIGRREGADVHEVVEAVPAGHAPDADPLPGTPKSKLGQSVLINLGLVVIGLAALTFASRLLIDSASDIARALGVSELAIALTIVAGGTSMPEMATSVMAAIRKQSDIAVGNILGSNIFNICCILGVTSLISPLTIREQVLWFDGPVMLLLAIALVPILFTGSRIARGEGAALVTAMVAYTLALFFLAPRWFPAPLPVGSTTPAQVIDAPARGDLPVE